MDHVEQPSGFRFGFGLMLGILAFIVFVPIATCAGCFSCAACITAASNTQTDTISAPRPSPPASPSPQELEEEAYKSKVEFKRIRLAEAADDELAVFGEVKNTGEKSLAWVKLQVLCLDKADKVVFEKEFLLLNTKALFAVDNTDKPLKPNFSRKFGIGLGDVPTAEWSRKVKVVVSELHFE